MTRVAWNKGLKGVYKDSLETKLKKSLALKGIKRSKATRKRMSLAKKGKSNHREGVKLSIETRLRMSISQKGCKRAKWTKSRRLRFSKQNSGSKSRFWKGGITRINKLVRSMVQNVFWRESVFKRDKHTCQGCGSKNVYLHADHIKPFAVIIGEYGIKTRKQALDCSELWDISNGRTLCVSCHKKTFTYKGRLRL